MTDPAAESSKSVKILSINILRGGYNRRKLLLENIEIINPDIIVLGEFWHTKTNGSIPLMNMLKEKGWLHQYYPKNLVCSAVGIASKIPACDHHVLEDYPDNVIAVEFPSLSDRTLIVIGAYMPYFSSEKMQPLWEKLYQYLTELDSSQNRFILAGDLNLCRRKEFKNYSLDIFEKCCTRFYDIGQQDPKPTHYKENGFRLDYLISNLDLKQLIEYTVHDRFLNEASDHCGISVKILSE